jgi:pimeloyl-ACP methyl ester carboxylesterase
LRRNDFLLGTAALGLAGCSNSNGATGTGPLPPSGIGPGHVSDLRYGFVSVPSTGNGYDPAGDAAALALPGNPPSPATSPIPGVQVLGSYATDERYVIRVPDKWNGKLIVAGTPSFRSEFANDAIWSDFALVNGYAFASSNKGIPYNSVVETIAASPMPNLSYGIPFDLLSLETNKLSVRFGAIQGAKKPITGWNADVYSLTLSAKAYLTQNYKAPTKTYVVGLSNGGAQVRALLEQHPEVVDGGVDWSGVYWSPSLNILTYLPGFVKLMQTYVASGFKDAATAAQIQALGYPADIKTASAAHPSLWFEYYAGQPAFYSDITVYAYALLIDPTVSATLPSTAVFTPNATNPAQLPGTPSAGVSGFADPQVRANYTLSAAGSSAITPFAHTGNIGKPLISIAGAADMFITVPNNATPYLNAVKSNGKGSMYWQYIVQGGTHVDTFANPTWGYGLQPQVAFAWAAFNQLVSIVESGATPGGAGTQQTVTKPTDIHSAARLGQ